MAPASSPSLSLHIVSRAWTNVFAAEGSVCNGYIGIVCFDLLLGVAEESLFQRNMSYMVQVSQKNTDYPNIVRELLTATIIKPFLVANKVTEGCLTLGSK